MMPRAPFIKIRLYVDKLVFCKGEELSESVSTYNPVASGSSAKHNISDAKFVIGLWKEHKQTKRGMEWPVLSKIVFTKLFQANFCCTIFFPTKTFKATMSEIFSFKCFVFQFFEKIFFIFQQKRIQWGPNCEWIFHLLSLLLF